MNWMSWVRLYAVWFWMPICWVCMVMANDSERPEVIYFGLGALLVVCIAISGFEYRTILFLKGLVAHETETASQEMIRQFINHTMPHRGVDPAGYFESIRIHHGVVRIGHLLLSLKSPLVYPDSTPSFSPASSSTEVQ